VRKKETKDVVGRSHQNRSGARFPSNYRGTGYSRRAGEGDRLDARPRVDIVFGDVSMNAAAPSA
jgi:hypothetical protein